MRDGRTRRAPSPVAVPRALGGAFAREGSVDGRRRRGCSRARSGRRERPLRIVQQVLRVPRRDAPRTVGARAVPLRRVDLPRRERGVADERGRSARGRRASRRGVRASRRRPRRGRSFVSRLSVDPGRAGCLVETPRSSARSRFCAPRDMLRWGTPDAGAEVAGSALRVLRRVEKKAVVCRRSSRRVPPPHEPPPASRGTRVWTQCGRLEGGDGTEDRSVSTSANASFTSVSCVLNARSKQKDAFFFVSSAAAAGCPLGDIDFGRAVPAGALGRRRDAFFVVRRVDWSLQEYRRGDGDRTRKR